MKFEFKGDPPSIDKMKENDLLGAAAIVLSSSYNNQEFFRCGYFLNVYFEDEEMNIDLFADRISNYLVQLSGQIHEDYHIKLMRKITRECYHCI